MKTPHWDLARVKVLAGKKDGLFVQVKRAVGFFGGDARSAIEAARKAVLGLTVKAFAETQTLTWDVADVYGVKMEDGRGWYLRLTIDEAVPEVAIISFHPLKRPLKTNGGLVKP